MRKVSELRKYEGTYWNYDDNYSRKIYILNDTLRYYRSSNSVTALLPVSSNRFEMLGNRDVKVSFEVEGGGANQMFVSVNDDRFFKFSKYEPANYSLQELESYVGLYFSPELDCHYEIRRQEDQLILFIEEKEVSPLIPVMKNYFINDRVGSISFSEMNRDEFLIKSGRVRDIKFSRQ